jgi:dephospho-CoA kinase
MIQEEKKILILIGGASGTGKTTLAKALEKRGIAYYQKIHDISLEMAREIAETKNLSIEDAFEKLDDGEVIKKMIEIVKQKKCVVTDMHFAIQPRVDTSLLLRKIPLDKDFWEESYVPTFSLQHLIEIIHCGILFVPILLVCETDVLIERLRLKHLQGFVVRSLNKKIIQQEQNAELQIYLFFTKELRLQPQVFDNSGEFKDLEERVTTFLKCIRLQKTALYI